MCYAFITVTNTQYHHMLLITNDNTDDNTDDKEDNYNDNSNSENDKDGKV